MDIIKLQFRPRVSSKNDIVIQLMHEECHCFTSILEESLLHKGRTTRRERYTMLYMYMQAYVASTIGRSDNIFFRLPLCWDTLFSQWFRLLFGRGGDVELPTLDEQIAPLYNCDQRVSNLRPSEDSAITSPFNQYLSFVYKDVEWHGANRQLLIA